MINIRRTSRTLTKLLRHDKEGLHMTGDGYVCITELLSLPSMAKVTLQDLQSIVVKDNKQRFTISKDTKIRANQGHSLPQVQDEEIYTRIQQASSLPLCIHGTYQDVLESILEEGLSPMKRSHIHFAPSLSTVAGLRHSANVHIYINVPLAMEEGIVFYRSSNNVILSRGNHSGVIPSHCFLKIVKYTKSWMSKEDGASGIIK